MDTRHYAAEAQAEALAEPAQEAAQAGWARRHGMPGRAARRIGHGVVLCLFAAAACVGWQVSSRGRGVT
jgi:hypothetical protein